LTYKATHQPDFYPVAVKIRQKIYLHYYYLIKETITVNAPLAVLQKQSCFQFEITHKPPFTGLKSKPTILSFEAKPVNATNCVSNAGIKRTNIFQVVAYGPGSVLNISLSLLSGQWFNINSFPIL
jgi:hypothetical protein